VICIYINQLAEMLQNFFLQPFGDRELSSCFESYEKMAQAIPAPSIDLMSGKGMTAGYF